METACRICLNLTPERSKFKKFYEQVDSISYLDMFTTLAADIEIKSEDVICTICSSELNISYNFLIKVRTNFLECKIENVKDPLEEDSCDEYFEKEEISDVKFDVIKFENSNNEESDELKEQSTFVDVNLKECSSSSEKCDDEFLLNNLLDLNVSPENLIFPRGRFKCQICEKSYFTSAGLNAHNVVHSPKTPTPSTKKKRLRRQHKKFPNETSDVTPISSNLNDANEPSNDYAEKPNLPKLESTVPKKTKQKLQKEKQAKPKKTFSCQVCGKEMISASKLRYHLVMHTGEKDFLCSMCPKAYSTIYALKHHFRSHSGYRPYECKFCGDRFYRPTTLKSHVRRHTGERPYGCEICGKRFIQHSSMTTHIKLNHMSKTIPCPHCDKKYARQTDLNTHLLSHTGDKPFSCQLCPSRFVRQANVNKHMKHQHSDYLAETKKKHKSLNEHSIELTSQLNDAQNVAIYDENK